MNPLQEYPHLFANGRFRAHMHNHKTDMVVIDIRSVDVSNEADVRINHHANVNELTLIARPISDMTDREIQKAMGNSIYKCEVYDLIDVEYVAKNGSRMLLYLLSIGVYPFDQSHFEDGTVIDAAGELI